MERIGRFRPTGRHYIVPGMPVTDQTHILFTVYFIPIFFRFSSLYVDYSGVNCMSQRILFGRVWSWYVFDPHNHPHVSFDFLSDATSSSTTLGDIPAADDDEAEATSRVQKFSRKEIERQTLVTWKQIVGHLQSILPSVPECAWSCSSHCKSRCIPTQSKQGSLRSRSSPQVILL